MGLWGWVLEEEKYICLSLERARSKEVRSKEPGLRPHPSRESSQIRCLDEQNRERRHAYLIFPPPPSSAGVPNRTTLPEREKCEMVAADARAAAREEMQIKL